MTSDRSKGLLWLIIGAILLAGVALTVQTVGRVRETGLRVERKLVDLARLGSIENEVKRCEAARQTVEKMPARSADPLLPLVQDMFAAYKAEDCRETRRDVIPGWIVRQTEVSFSDVSFAGVMELVRKAEAMEPPWRLAKCTFRASSAVPGAGQAVLQLEALQRRE